MTAVTESKPDLSTLDLTTLTKEELIVHVQENKTLKEKVESFELQRGRNSEDGENTLLDRDFEQVQCEHTYIEPDIGSTQHSYIMNQYASPIHAASFEDNHRGNVLPADTGNVVEILAAKPTESSEPNSADPSKPNLEAKEDEVKEVEFKEIEAYIRFQEMTDLIRNMNKSPSVVLTQQEADLLQGQLALKPAKDRYDMKLWEKEIMPFVKDKLLWEKTKKTIKAHIHNFMPTKFRSTVWPKLIGNPLKIKRKVYEHFCKLLPDNPTDPKILYIIKEDLVRTYPSYKCFKRGEALNTELQCLLELFQFSRPDIGYIQGMAYPAAMLLLHMDRYHAYKCLTNMIVCSDFLVSLYCFQIDKMKAYFKAFDHYLERRNPLAFKHLAKMQLQSDTFLVEWFYTMYCRAFTIHDAAKIWDMFLVDGEVVFFRIALRIFKAIEPQLLKKDYSQTMFFLKSCTTNLDIDLLLKDMHNSKLTAERLEKFYEKERKKQGPNGK